MDPLCLRPKRGYGGTVLCSPVLYKIDRQTDWGSALPSERIIHLVGTRRLPMLRVRLSQSSLSIEQI